MRPTRRGFVASITAPVILGADDKAGSKKPILGEGEHRYEATHDWGELPANIKYGNTHGVVEDSQGFIYVHHTVNGASESHDTMVVFDDKGKFVKSWGKDFKGGAHGLHIAKEGNDEFIYLCDTKRALVVKTTLSGEEIFTLGYPEESEAYKPGADGAKKKYSPTNIAIAPNGDIYVGDGYGSSYINQYDKKGKFLRTIGTPGKEAGQMLCPHGLYVDTRGKVPVLTVADRTNKRLQTFTLEGQHISFGSGVSSPCHFNMRQGKVVIPDLDARVTLLDEKNEVITHLGAADDPKEARALRTKDRTEFVPGQFICPHGACFDHAGNIFVVEWVDVGRVTKLRKI